MKAMEGILVAVIFIVAGCAVGKATYLPDGSAGHSINCSGSALTWASCYEKAGAVCGARGYDVVAGGEDKAMMASSTPQYGFFAMPVVNRTMLVRCKGSPS